MLQNIFVSFLVIFPSGSDQNANFSALTLPWEERMTIFQAALITGCLERIRKKAEASEIVQTGHPENQKNLIFRVSIS